VKKTEDLLRRYNKTRKSGFSLFGSKEPVEDVGEEERFNKQMEVDVQALKVDARTLGVDVEVLSGWKELVEVVSRPPE
jgi:hypothetical protein